MHYEEDDIQKGGFEDIPRDMRCMHPAHNPPSHMVIPAGKQYRHVCPSCGKQTLVRNPIIFWA